MVGRGLRFRIGRGRCSHESPQQVGNRHKYQYQNYADPHCLPHVDILDGTDPWRGAYELVSILLEHKAHMICHETLHDGGIPRRLEMSRQQLQGGEASGQGKGATPWLTPRSQELRSNSTSYVVGF